MCTPHGSHPCMGVAQIWGQLPCNSAARPPQEARAPGDGPTHKRAPGSQMQGQVLPAPQRLDPWKEAQMAPSNNQPGWQSMPSLSFQT